MEPTQATPEVTTPTPPPAKRRRLIYLIVVLVVVAIVFFVLEALNPKAQDIKPNSTTVKTVPAAVSITSNGFVPATISIKAGQAVIWTNTDVAKHEVNSDPYPSDNALAAFNDQQPLAQNDTYSYIFSKSGTYTYHDDLNPLKFKGTIVVK
jgi:plastocyanin